MKLGTHVRLADGREGTVVYRGLDGEGIKFGIHYPKEKDFENTHGNLFQAEKPPEWPWRPDAMLREKSLEPIIKMECVGEDYEVIE